MAGLSFPVLFLRGGVSWLSTILLSPSFCLLGLDALGFPSRWSTETGIQGVPDHPQARVKIFIW